MTAILSHSDFLLGMGCMLGFTLNESKDDIAPEGPAVTPAPDMDGQVFLHRVKPNNVPTVSLTVDEPLNVLDRVGGG